VTRAAPGRACRCGTRYRWADARRQRRGGQSRRRGKRCRSCRSPRRRGGGSPRARKRSGTTDRLRWRGRGGTSPRSRAPGTFPARDNPSMSAIRTWSSPSGTRRMRRCWASGRRGSRWRCTTACLWLFRDSTPSTLRRGPRRRAGRAR